MLSKKIISGYSGLPTDHESDEVLIAKFETAISDDLNTPIAIALLQEAKSKKVIDTMDRVFGLGLKNLAEKMFDTGRNQRASK
jgi:cysteinyl-tRNA synthetase